MVFVLSAYENRLFCMLTEQDVSNIRGGRTVFVDDHQLKGAEIKGVSISLHKSNDEALQVLKRAGHQIDPESLVVPQPRPLELKCEGCQAICLASILHKGMCISCWCEKAEYLERLKGEAS